MVRERMLQDWERVTGFFKGNPLVSGLLVLVVLAVLGLFLPVDSRDWEIEVENVGVSMSALMNRLAVLEEEVAGVRPQASELSGRIGNVDERLTALEILQGVIDKDLQSSKKRWDSFASAWEKVAGYSVDIEGQLDIINLEEIAKLEDRISQLEAYFGVAIPQKVIFFNEDNGFGTAVGWCPLQGGAWVGEQFRTDGHRLDVRGIKLYLKREAGSPSTVSVRIYATVAGLPIGSPLWYIIVDASQWSDVGEWHSFDVRGLMLQPTTTYAIILEDTDGNDSNRICVGYNYDDKYGNGSWVKSTDGGKSWSLTLHADAAFEVWGIVQ